MKQTVKGAILIYAFLGMIDLVCTVLALAIGVKEANPILAWFHTHGLFLYAKLGATMLVVIIGQYLWHLKIVRGVLVGGNLIMLAIAAVHFDFWSQHWQMFPGLH